MRDTPPFYPIPNTDKLLPGPSNWLEEDSNFYFSNLCNECKTGALNYLRGEEATKIAGPKLFVLPPPPPKTG